MDNVTHLLPKLTVNRQFIDDFLSAKPPCFALGMIEERKQKLALLALRPGEVISHEEGVAKHLTSPPNKSSLTGVNKIQEISQ